MEGEGQVNIFELEGVLRAVARVELSGCSGGRHDCNSAGNTLIARVLRGREQLSRGPLI